MTDLMTRRHLIAGLLATVSASAAAPAVADSPVSSPRPPRRPDLLPAQAARPATAAPGLGALVEAAKLGGTVGILVAEAATGRVLEGLNADIALPPASCAKAPTAMFGLSRLGSGFRWPTRVLATGPVSGGIVQGDLILQGTGDPSLSTDALGDLAARLAGRGVRGVSGWFLIHAANIPKIPRIDAAQPDHVGYNPAICGLNLNYNRVHFEWRRAGADWSLTMDARGERFVPPVGMATMRVANREAPLFTYREGRGVDEWTVASAALGKGGARWMPVRQPEVYAGDVFRTLAGAQGLRLPASTVVERAPANTLELARLDSEPLPVILRDMLKYSTNLTAEVVGLTASGAPGLAASGQAMSDWMHKEAGAGGRFVDHSGLGGASRVSPVQMVDALTRGRAMGLPGLLKDWGVRGENSAGLKAAGVRVPAKTGTLNFVSGLVGHIEPPAGRALTFAILCADVKRRDGLSKAEREEPPGGKSWAKRARGLQAQLVARWAGQFA
jgi:D-alanyl-D-alanine carboxypeptidase/D-alanyl-D-alanine-endopeptidase (penicillin-binding protein 4)